MHFTLRKLYAATRFIRYRVNMTDADYRQERDAKTAIAIVERHTASLK